MQASGKWLKYHRFWNCIPLIDLQDDCASNNKLETSSAKKKLTRTMIKMIIIMRQVMLRELQHQHERVFFCMEVCKWWCWRSLGLVRCACMCALHCVHQLEFYYAAKVDVNQYPAIMRCFADTFFQAIQVPRAIPFCWLNSCSCYCFI